MRLPQNTNSYPLGVLLFYYELVVTQLSKIPPFIYISGRPGYPHALNN
jgi:hypothetical protein